MTIMENIFDTWALTLVHSLWQGLLIFMILKIILKFIPAAQARARHSAAVAALVLFAVASVMTFYSLMPGSSRELAFTGVTDGIFSQAFVATPESGELGALIKEQLLQYSSQILTLWLFGASLFLLRLTGSWWYIEHITETGTPVTGPWKNKVDKLALQLGVSRRIRMIESTRIDAPFVAGLLSPVIFVPAGLAAGMPAQQLEAIFIHEIIHIKRYDYLVSVFQSVIESLFFFNPFVWKMSNMIKTEREHCCDDAVVKSGADKKAYVYALASLEETRLSRNGLALSAAGNKNQLFNRIKRLMEGSTKNYSLREKLIPAVLLVVGLICASWFSLNRKAPHEPANAADFSLVSQAQDTTIRKKDKKDRVKRKEAREAPKKESAIESKDEVSAEVDIEAPIAPDFEIPEPPEFNVIIPEIPEFPVELFSQEYSEEFKKRFKERFGDFYEKHEQEIARIMADIEREKHNEIAAMHLAHGKSQDALREHQDRIRKINDEQMRKHEVQMREFEAKMRVWEEKNRVKMEKLEKRMKIFEKNLQVFNGKLREELVRDGYLKQDEKLESVRMSNDKEIMEVNGKRIRESDVAKYQEFHKKHFPKMNEEDKE